MKSAMLVKCGLRYAIKTDLPSAIEEMTYPTKTEAEQAMGIWLISSDDKVVKSSDGR